MDCKLTASEVIDAYNNALMEVSKYDYFAYKYVLYVQILVMRNIFDLAQKKEERG